MYMYVCVYFLRQMQVDSRSCLSSWSAALLSLLLLDFSGVCVALCLLPMHVELHCCCSFPELRGFFQLSIQLLPDVSEAPKLVEALICIGAS